MCRSHPLKSQRNGSSAPPCLSVWGSSQGTVVQMWACPNALSGAVAKGRWCRCGHALMPYLAAQTQAAPRTGRRRCLVQSALASARLPRRHRAAVRAAAVTAHNIDALSPLHTVSAVHSETFPRSVSLCTGPRPCQPVYTPQMRAYQARAFPRTSAGRASQKSMVLWCTLFQKAYQNQPSVNWYTDLLSYLSFSAGNQATSAASNT